MRRFPATRRPSACSMENATARGCSRSPASSGTRRPLFSCAKERGIGFAGSPRRWRSICAVTRRSRARIFSGRAASKTAARRCSSRLEAGSSARRAEDAKSSSTSPRNRPARNRSPSRSFRLLASARSGAAGTGSISSFSSKRKRRSGRSDPTSKAVRRETGGGRGVIVTSRTSSPDLDFVSRYFAPAAGIDEDPVTGSTHCALGPFWSERLGKRDLRAAQLSARGGTALSPHRGAKPRVSRGIRGHRVSGGARGPGKNRKSPKIRVK